MQDGQAILSFVNAIGSNVYAFGALVAVIMAAIIFGLTWLDRPLPRRRRGRH
jgi:hypothetical protein